MNEHENNSPAALLLEGLRPAAPSADLMQRLLAARPALQRPPENAKVISLFPMLARAAVVAAIAGTATWYLMADRATPETVSSPPPATGPVADGAPQQSLQRLLGMRDLGFARDARQRPVRLMHATWLDDNTYLPPNGAPPVHEARVRDEIVPVVLNTY